MKGSMQCVKQKSKAIIWIEGGKDYPTIEKCRWEMKIVLQVYTEHSVLGSLN